MLLGREGAEKCATLFLAQLSVLKTIAAMRFQFGGKVRCYSTYASAAAALSCFRFPYGRRDEREFSINEASKISSFCTLSLSIAPWPDNYRSERCAVKVQCLIKLLIKCRIAIIKFLKNPRCLRHSSRWLLYLRLKIRARIGPISSISYFQV